MVWTQQKPGLWVDDLDGAEKVFYNLSQAFRGLGKEHAAVYCVCKIHFPDTSPAARESLVHHAWEALRIEHPSLGVVVEESQKRYTTASPASMEDWVSETFSVTELPADAVIPTLHLKRLPCLIFLPLSSEIIFYCSHWRIDALGTCMLMDRLLDLMSQGLEDPPSYDLEYERLTPSLEDAFGAPESPTPAMEAVAKTIRRRNFETAYPSAGLPYVGERSTLPASSRSYAVELSAEATERLILACRARDISITAAIHAATAKVVFAYSAENDYDYSTVVSVNMRDYLPSPYNTKAYACATYVTGITHTVHSVDDFATSSAQLTKAYRGSWEPLEYMAALRFIYKEHGEVLQEVIKSGSREPASNITVSSLGLVEKHLRYDHGLIQVERFHLGSAIMGRQPTLYIWTFRGRLTLSMDFNEAYYGPDIIEEVLKRVVYCLQNELSLFLQIG